ncbi:MAG: twin-arginine translocation signal domain-containing protein [Deltaproteobacteria bacterium]|nr:twin-arginine translocation signal domain-containing protein [Deltaproteobacteria bacterium]
MERDDSKPPSLNRRHFLGAAGAAAGTVAFGATSLVACAPRPSPRRKRRGTTSSTSS